MIRLPITAARAIEVDLSTWLELESAGHTWWLDRPKATLLQYGLVILPPELQEYAETYGVPGSTELEDVPVPGASADPVLLELARRLWVGDYRPGAPVEIPSLAEAEAAAWEIDPGAGIFRRKVSR